MPRKRLRPILMFKQNIWRQTRGFGIFFWEPPQITVRQDSGSELSVSAALEGAESRLAAENVLVSPAAGDADGAAYPYAFDQGKSTGHRHKATTMGDDETAKPRLAGALDQLGRGHVEGGGGVGLVEGEFSRAGLGTVHLSEGNGNSGFINNRSGHHDPGSLGVSVRCMDHFPGLIRRYRPYRCFVLAEKAGVHLDRCLVFGRNVDILKNRVHRADDLALLAIDAHFRVNIKLRCPRLGVDTCYGANLHAGAVIGAQTGDDVGHRSLLCSESQISDDRF